MLYCAKQIATVMHFWLAELFVFQVKWLTNCGLGAWKGTLMQRAAPGPWCCTGVGWLTLPSANVLPFHGLDECVQMPVVGKQQLYNGFAQAEWFREQWEAGSAAKSVKTAFQRERVAGREGKLVCGKGCQGFTGNVFNVSWLVCGSLC